MSKEEKKNLLIFWIRFVLWIVMCAIVPFVYIVIKFKLFQVTGEKTVASIAFGGWGIVAVLVLYFTIKAICKYIIADPVYSMTKQVLSGLVRIILPLGVIAVIGYTLFTVFDDGLKEFLTFMTVLLVCEAVAIPLNPWEKWLYDRKVSIAENVNEKSNTDLVEKLAKVMGYGSNGNNNGD